MGSKNKDKRSDALVGWKNVNLRLPPAVKEAAEKETSANGAMTDTLRDALKQARPDWPW
jgi:hypothetical protein